MKKTIFTLNVDHVIDIITNSSSELFVLEADTLKIAAKMIAEVYPDYTSEYELKTTKELTPDELNTYLDYKGYYNGQRELPDSIFNIAPELLWKNWNNRFDRKYYHKSISDSGAELVKEKMDPKNKMFFLFSLDENPDWDYQEKLMEIATRYHLG